MQQGYTTEEWQAEYHGTLDELRSGACVITEQQEFMLQQKLYSKFARQFDEFASPVGYEKAQGCVILAKEISEMIQNKTIKVLDFGAGTGLVAEELNKVGFTNVDALDCSVDLLSVASEKGVYQHHIVTTGDPSDTSNIPDNTYDLICSAGTFFLTKTHPGGKFFREMARITKPGGMIVIVTSSLYLEQDYHQWDLIDALVKEGELKIRPIKRVPEYKSNSEVHGIAPDAAVMCYDIVKQVVVDREDIV